MKNVVIVVLSLVVILLGGYLLNTEVINKKECPTVLEQKEEVKAEETSINERYKSYLANIAKGRKGWVKTFTIGKGTDNSGYIYDLGTDNNLYLEYEDSMGDVNKVDIPGDSGSVGIKLNLANVVDIFKIDSYGLDALEMLFAITSDGNLYLVTTGNDQIEKMLDSNYKPELVESVKNITDLSMVMVCTEIGCSFDYEIVDLDGNVKLFSDYEELVNLFYKYLEV